MRDTYLVSFSLAVFLDLVLHSEKTRVIDACVKRDAYLNGALCVLGGLRSRALSMSPFFFCGVERSLCLLRLCFTFSRSRFRSHPRPRHRPRASAVSPSPSLSPFLRVFLCMCARTRVCHARARALLLSPFSLSRSLVSASSCILLSLPHPLP